MRSHNVLSIISLKEQVEGKEFSFKKELNQQANEFDIITAVAKYYHKTSEELCKTRSHPAIEKKIAIYLIKRLTPLTNNQIGKIFGISFSAACKAGKTIITLIDKDANVRKAVEEIISTFKA